MSSSSSTSTTTNNNKSTSAHEEKIPKENTTSSGENIKMEEKTKTTEKKATASANGATAAANGATAAANGATSKGTDNVAKTNGTTTQTPVVASKVDMNVIVQDLQTILKDYIVIIFFAFLAVFILIRIFGQESIFGKMSSLMIDIFVLAILFTWVGYDFIFTYSGEERTLKIKEFWNSVKNYLSDSYSILYTSLFILVFYTFVYAVGIPMTSGNKSVFVSLLDMGAWSALVVSVIHWILKTFFGISLFDDFGKTKEEEKEEDVIIPNGKENEKKSPVPSNQEVFNIGVNKYTYEDAQSICKSYGARLATYDEIEKAYNNGAEWCNYGWSEGQMAYFPTQKATWTELQKDPKRKNDCGRPGVNGGYMVNPYLRFGVNCYGKKPEPSPSELAKMHVRKETTVPKTKEDLELEMKVQFWKENADKLLTINSFNANKWSQYK